MLHPDLLLSFSTVAETASFTLAAERLGLRQSTVSQHIKRLETAIRRPLFARDTHSVALTSDGAAMLDHARGILDLNRRLRRHFEGSELRGRLRFGVSKDFATSRLPDVLGDFTAQHRHIDLELTIDVSGHLYERLDGGDLDVIFAKRRRGDRRGQVAWTEQIVWAGRPNLEVDAGKALPLIVYPPPSISRAYAIDALETAGRAWRIACTSGSLAGLRAAALAGLGVMPYAARLLPPGLVLLTARDLPELGTVDFVAIGPGRHDKAATALIQTLLVNSSRLRSPRPEAR